MVGSPLQLSAGEKKSILAASDARKSTISETETDTSERFYLMQSAVTVSRYLCNIIQLTAYILHIPQCTNTHISPRGNPSVKSRTCSMREHVLVVERLAFTVRPYLKHLWMFSLSDLVEVKDQLSVRLPVFNGE